MIYQDYIFFSDLYELISSWIVWPPFYSVLTLQHQHKSVTDCNIFYTFYFNSISLFLFLFNFHFILFLSYSFYSMPSWCPFIQKLPLSVLSMWKVGRSEDGWIGINTNQWNSCLKPLIAFSWIRYLRNLQLTAFFETHFGLFKGLQHFASQN